MKLLHALLLGVVLATSSFALVACEQESALEEGAEEISDEIDDATTN